MQSTWSCVFFCRSWRWRCWWRVTSTAAVSTRTRQSRRVTRRATRCASRTRRRSTAPACTPSPRSPPPWRCEHCAMEVWTLHQGGVNTALIIEENTGPWRCELCAMEVWTLRYGGVNSAPWSVNSALIICNESTMFVLSVLFLFVSYQFACLKKRHLRFIVVQKLLQLNTLYRFVFVCVFSIV